MAAIFGAPGHRPFSVVRLAELPHPDQPFKPEFEGQQFDIDFDDRGTSNWQDRLFANDRYLAWIQGCANWHNSVAYKLTAWPQLCICGCSGEVTKSNLRSSA